MDETMTFKELKTAIGKATRVMVFTKLTECGDYVEAKPESVLKQAGNYHHAAGNGSIFRADLDADLVLWIQ